MNEYEEDLNLLKSDFKKGFSLGYQAVGVGCALSLFDLKYSDNDVIEALRIEYKEVLDKSNLDRVVEDQIDYFVELVEQESTLIFEEKEKMEELYLGIKEMLKIGVVCDPFFQDKFDRSFKKMKYNSVAIKEKSK